MAATLSRPHCVNSLATGRCGSSFKGVISKHMLQIKFMSTFCEITHRRMPLNTSDDKSIVVQVMAWSHQATVITWANVDPDLHHHLASLGHNGSRNITEFNICIVGDKLLSERMMVEFTDVYVSLNLHELDHLPLVPHICISKWGQQWFR